MTCGSFLADVVAHNYDTACQTSVKEAFKILLDDAASGRYSKIAEELGLCVAPTTEQEVQNKCPVSIGAKKL